MSYDDTNEELRIRQRSILKGQSLILAAIGTALLVYGYVEMGGFRLLAPLAGLVYFIGGLYLVNRSKEGTWSRHIHRRVNDSEDTVPIHNFDKLKKSARSDYVTDGGEGEDQ